MTEQPRAAERGARESAGEAEGRIVSSARPSQPSPSLSETWAGTLADEGARAASAVPAGRASSWAVLAFTSAPEGGEAVQPMDDCVHDADTAEVALLRHPRPELTPVRHDVAWGCRRSRGRARARERPPPATAALGQGRITSSTRPCAALERRTTPAAAAVRATQPLWEMRRFGVRTN